MLDFECIGISLNINLEKYFLNSLSTPQLGEEVALYCSKYLPDIIKEQKNYKDGKLQKVKKKTF